MATKSDLQERLAIVETTLRDYEAKYKTANGVGDLNMLERGISAMHAEHTELRNKMTKLADDEMVGVE